MASPAIKVENLSKRFRISHQAERGKYKTLRDTLAGGVQNLAARLRRSDRSDGVVDQATEDFFALRDVSFEIHPGEVVGIIGRNGAGKSTLLKILSRITSPTAGRATLNGRVGSLLEVGTGFHPELTGRENIYLNGSILGMTRREIATKFDAIVEFSGVERFLDTPVKRYSSGMYVRLAFAVAAHLEPEIMLVDEVLAVGDAEFQAKCMGKMGEVARGGRTVILVSHNMAAIQQVCRRVIVLRRGEVFRDGRTDRVIVSYLSDAHDSTDGTFDLSNHTARAPGKTPILKRLTLRRADGIRTVDFVTGQRLTIDIELESTQAIREPSVAVAVEDAYGRRIFTVASNFCEERLPEIRGTGRYACTVPSLPLGSGRYLISASVSDRYLGLIDSLDCAAWFNVQWNNNYGNGEPYHSVYGPVIQPSVWTQVSSDAAAGEEHVH